MNKTVVLVVEDDRPIRNLIVTTLKMHDYKYLTANNGVSAIMEASSHHPDIVLLDLGLPDMEGVDVLYFTLRGSVINHSSFSILLAKTSSYNTCGHDSLSISVSSSTTVTI